ncbi:MAG: ABC-type transport auxiliary lipoprotein family protein [Rhodocyclaceae bacterium]|nr:ABC-type transport auxiliary lipoprotein family protein [Rhodocyclaceae bacterium]
MRLTIILLSLFLSACVGNPPRSADIARHDLGDMPGNAPAFGIPIAVVEVRAAAWLDSPAQFYRLAYADVTRRAAYAGSRWVAPPGELLERWLQRRSAFGQAAPGGPGCRLRLALDELEQRFAAPQSSEAVLEVRATLLPLHGEAVLAKRAFRIVKAAPTPDARGGVAATRAAADALSGELAQWLAELARERPQAVSICKEK